VRNADLVGGGGGNGEGKEEDEGGDAPVHWSRAVTGRSVQFGRGASARDLGGGGGQPGDPRGHGGRLRS
jgi:hypothetical protein